MTSVDSLLQQFYTSHADKLCVEYGITKEEAKALLYSTFVLSNRVVDQYIETKSRESAS